VPDVSLEAFARYYGVGSLGGLAQKAHKHWPPPPQISIREVLGIIGLPLPSDNPNVVTKPTGTTRALCSFSWQDEGAGTPLQATSWAWKIHTTNSSTAVAQGTVTEPSAGPVTLEDDDYYLELAPSNQFGTGPSEEALQFDVVPNVPPKPTIAATVASSDVVTVTGHGFQANEVIHLQATVKAGLKTPLLANGVPDLRNQFVTATATPSGTFTALIQPNGFSLASFQDGEQAHVIAGESIATVVVNNGSNIVTVTAPSTV
jgi:hypothetical protein